MPSDVATPAATPTLETVTCAEPTEAFAVLCEAYAQIKGEYVDAVTDEDLVDGAVRGMVEFGLEDPYSGYLPPEQYGSALDDLSGEFSGIGAEVGMENIANPDDLASCTVVTENCALVIVAPLAGSPAEEAGLRAGDRVLEIDGVSTIGESVSSLVFTGARRSRHRRHAHRRARRASSSTSRSPGPSSTSRRSTPGCSRTASATSG